MLNREQIEVRERQLRTDGVDLMSRITETKSIKGDLKRAAAAIPPLGVASDVDRTPEIGGLIGAIDGGAGEHRLSVSHGPARPTAAGIVCSSISMPSERISRMRP